MHRAHGDVHIEGLADNCGGCEEIAEEPFREADERLLRQLIELAVDRERLAKGRSTNELVASAKILTLFEKMGRACEVAGDVVAEYLRDRWHLEAVVQPRLELSGYPPPSPETKARVGRVLDLGAAVILLLDNGTDRERIHELVDVAADEHAGTS